MDELLRLRRLASRLLLLAATDSPDFLRLAPVDVADLMLETLHRWSHTPRRWSLGTLAEASVQADERPADPGPGRAESRTPSITPTPDGQIELSARRDGESVILAVTDSGPGIPAAEVGRIFGRFARIDVGPQPGDRRVRPRARGGEGDHRGAPAARSNVRSTMGQGSVFELHLPASPAWAGSRPHPDQRAVSR